MVAGFMGQEARLCCNKMEWQWGNVEHRPLLKGGPTGRGGGGGGWVRGLWGGWVSFVLGDLAQRAYSPPPGGGGLGGWVGDLCCCFLCFQLQRHFFCKNKSDGRPYKGLIIVIQ